NPAATAHHRLRVMVVAAAVRACRPDSQGRTRLMVAKPELSSRDVPEVPPIHNTCAAVAFSSSLPRSSFHNATAIHSPLISRCRHCNYQVRIGTLQKGADSPRCPSGFDGT